ncbi:hypothetical protein OIU77_025565 [Salix suchowensis]|uniref:Uncharacterized protein n=1 Tax=Salix suchowensis TaxID=1278906 RepID=A0ABQ9BWP8_9ROSI|nr:hypothetical protein OIU78_012285 [Salix suchowensis]KAJ6391618.1 hypothetical protein OIU77_025565 [Salix suchowensis]
MSSLNMVLNCASSREIGSELLNVENRIRHQTKKLVNLCA